MSSPSELNQPSDYAPRRLRGLGSLGVRIEGCQPVPSNRFDSSVDQSAQAVEAHLAAFKKALATEDIKPVPPAQSILKSPREADRGQVARNVTEWLRTAAIFVCVAITGGAFAIGAQLGYEQWTKSATAAKRHALLATPVPSEASPEKIAADLPQRATDGQSRSYPAVLERSLVAVQ